MFVLWDTSKDKAVAGFRDNGVVELVLETGRSPLIFDTLEEVVDKLRSLPAVTHITRNPITIRRAKPAPEFKYEDI